MPAPVQQLLQCAARAGRMLRFVAEPDDDPSLGNSRGRRTRVGVSGRERLRYGGNDRALGVAHAVPAEANEVALARGFRNRPRNANDELSICVHVELAARSAQQVGPRSNAVLGQRQQRCDHFRSHGDPPNAPEWHRVANHLTRRPPAARAAARHAAGTIARRSASPCLTGSLGWPPLLKYRIVIEQCDDLMSFHSAVRKFARGASP